MLAGLIIPIGYLIMRGYEQRTGAHYLAAAALIGFTMTIKLHAAGMLASLILAFLLRPPRDAADAVRMIGRGFRRHRILVGLATSAWLLAAIYFNTTRIPFRLAQDTTTPIEDFLFVVGLYTLGVILARQWETPRLIRRLFDPFLVIGAAALAIGVAIPTLIILDDGLASIRNISLGLRGDGVNTGVSAFSDWSSLLHYPLLGPLIVFLVSTAAAIVGTLRRDARPVIWYVGALTLEVMAIERFGHVHYFAPGYVAAIPATLWLAKQLGRLATPLAMGLVAVALLPVLTNAYVNPPTLEPIVGPTAKALAASSRLVGPGQVIVTPDWLSLPDVLYYHLVQSYVAWTPDYPYRFLPVSAAGLAQARHLQPRYAVLGVGAGGSLNFGKRYTTRAVSYPPAAAAHLVRLRPR